MTHRIKLAEILAVDSARSEVLLIRQFCKPDQIQMVGRMQGQPAVAFKCLSTEQNKENAVCGCNYTILIEKRNNKYSGPGDSSCSFKKQLGVVTVAASVWSPGPV